MIGKRTPGPWRHRPNEHDDWGLVRAADGMPVVTAHVAARVPDDYSPPWVNGGFPEPPEITANAKLIAAAPDLLAACQAAGDGIYYGFYSEHQKRHVLDQLRTAIEKAEPQK
jgi:hypothetical protein